MNKDGLTGVELYSERNFPTKHDVLKYDVISKKTRVQILQKLYDLLPDLTEKDEDWGRYDTFYNIMVNLKHRRGVLIYKELLSGATKAGLTYENEVVKTYSYLDENEQEFYTLLIYADFDDYLLILDLIELLSYWINKFHDKQSSRKVDQMINELFRINGVGYELIENRVIHKGNEVVHKDVVRPALYFLSDPIYAGANNEMLQAFADFKDNNFKSSIHNASKAFESTMKIIIENNNWDLVSPNSRQPVPKLQKATANVLIATITKNADIESFGLLAIKGLKDTLQVLATLRNIHTGHGQGSEIKETYIRHCEFAIHTAATNILFLIKTYG